MNFFVKTCIILKICYFVFCEKDHAKIRNIINLSNISSITKRYIMKTLQMIHYFNFVIATVFVVFYFYQIGYLLLGLLMKHRKNKTGSHQFHRYAAVISARNEANVIGGLIASLKAQNYPSDLLDIYVIADNCTDNTAQVAAQAGARVYRRYNHQQVGKGYALDYLFKCLSASGKDVYDGYFVFDADNYVDPDFVKEMNATFDSGHFAALTSYRNSKNYGANWISAGYSLWFLREARFLNFPRMLLGTNCAISGTGFLVSGEVIRENGGWPFHLLTEDIEFSVNCAIEGKVIGYCDKAVIYDEQPLKFGQSWTQRLRWSKGFYQVDWHYSWRLIKGFFQGGRKSFSCYDIFMTVAPGMFFTLAAILINLGMAFSYMTEPGYIARMIAAENISFLTRTIVMFYLSLLVYGAITMISEWKQVQLSALKKILYTFTFPIFMFTYIPISAVALVKKVEWKPICHGNTSGELITSKRN